MKKVLAVICAVCLFASAVFVAEGETVENGGSVYSVVGDNLFEYPNFADGSTRIAGSEFYVGTNTGTSWDGNVPNPVTGENLTPLADKISDTSESNRGSSFYYAEDSGSGERNKYYLCENISSASGAFWNGTNSLLAYVPIEGGKTYYFSYYQSAWGGSLKSSVRYGAINSENYCDEASNGKIVWSGTGGVDAAQYDGDNVEEVGWTKFEAIIEADEDADYFFFNLYWLQALDYVCINGFTLCEVEEPEIAEIATTEIAVYAGEEPNLPSKVSVTYETGDTGTASVVWNDDEYDALRDGEYTITGTVTAGGREYTAEAKITVYSSSITDGYTVTKSLANKDGILTAEIGVYTDEDDKIMAALSLYEDETLISVASTIFNTGEESEIVLTMPAPTESGRSAKIIIWNADKLCPLTLCNAESVGVKDGGDFVALSDVRLTEGMFKDAQDLNTEYLLEIDVDRLLAPSFEMAGLDTPNGAERYGGWERKGANNWTSSSADTFTLAGHSLGHWMSAAAATYSSTGNATIKERLDYAVEKLSEIQKETGSGYIGGIDETCFEKLFAGNVSSWSSGYWVPWYGVHKIYQGLLDAYNMAGNETALSVVIKFADWAVEGTSNLTDDEMQTMLDVEYGGMNEVFAELYDITGEEKYLETAVRFTHDEILEPLSQETDELTGLHANTQIPKIIGAAAIFEQDDSRTDYETAAKYFWNTVVYNRSYVIGGNSVSEHFEALGAETLHKKTCESCNVYNMIKLTEHLFSWDHDGAYMDYVETVLYNDILGAQDPETGNKMYFTSLLQGHFRIYGDSDEAWWCCTGTGMENPGRYARCAYYKDKNELYVNLYIPSTMRWNELGLSFEQKTDFPYSDTATLTVTGGSAEAAVKLRVPSWTNGEMSVSVNGEAVEMVEEKGYVTIEREWSEGDEIEITLPMSLTLYEARDDENKVAFKYGPIVLAAALGDEGLPEDTRTSETDIPDTTVSVPSLTSESRDPADFIETVDLSSLTFKISGDYTSSGEELTLMPFYSIHHQFHNVYWYLNSEADPYDKALGDITVDSVTPDGQQDEIGHNLVSNNSHNGSFTSGISTYYWRDAYGDDAYFSYDLKCADYLYVSYWGSDGTFTTGGVTYKRDFEIYVDGVKIAEQTLESPASGETYNVFYEIPAELTEGKGSITVMFKPKDGNYCAGGVLDVRTTTAGSVDVE
ncbi:MAG: glycoside hydrolase family 127 protein [Clostridia bacterium]|nr:glycoside hydrolase family 127 protein [Clostridia bacterium]